MRVRVFDTETTGLPRNHNLSSSNYYNYDTARLIELAYIDYNVQKNSATEIMRRTHLIKQAAPIPNTQFHGISDELVNFTGIDIASAMTEFFREFHLCDLLVAHNIQFDHGVVCAELYRKIATQSDDQLRTYLRQLETKPLHCTVLQSEVLFSKYMKLDILYKTLTGQDFRGAHRAENDAVACAVCYFKMNNITLKN
jgi:DNA polymerase III subunit epsilon